MRRRPALPPLPEWAPAVVESWPPGDGAGPREPLPLPRALDWALRFLPDYFSLPPCALHAELLATLADPPRRCIARVAPRGHAKSTCAALAFPLWCVCERRRRNMVIVTHERGLATQFVRDLRSELECNVALHAYYGDLAAGAAEGTERRGRRRWSESHFTTATGISVHAKSTGASFRGLRSGPYRPDLIICDDLEKDEHVASPAARRKLEHWLRRVVMPALAPDGLLLLLGTLLHHDALLGRVGDPERFPEWDYRVYRAIEPAPGEAGGPVALWPARWPLERLAEERVRLGTLAFEQEYQANPSDAAERVFHAEWLRRDVQAPDPGRLVTLVAVDPATGRDRGDFFALWAGGLDPATGILYTHELSLHRVDTVAQVRMVVAACERWRPAKVGIETNAYQVALLEAVEECGRRWGLFLPLVRLHTASRKEGRIEGLAPLIESGLFVLPAAMSREVEEQFLYYPRGGHDDAPDVCTLAVELARTMAIGPAGGRVVRGTKVMVGW